MKFEKTKIQKGTGNEPMRFFTCVLCSPWCMGINMKTRILYVPANVSLRSEVWRGLSVADAAKSIACGIIAAIVCAVLHFTVGVEVIWCVLGAVITVAFCITFLTQFVSGLSVKDYLRIASKFSREQKRFYYVHRRKE